MFTLVADLIKKLVVSGLPKMGKPKLVCSKSEHRCRKQPVSTC